MGLPRSLEVVGRFTAEGVSVPRHPTTSLVGLWNLIWTCPRRTGKSTTMCMPLFPKMDTLIAILVVLRMDALSSIGQKTTATVGRPPPGILTVKVMTMVESSTKVASEIAHMLK